MTRRRLAAYALLLALAGALTFAVSVAEAHPVKRPPDYPFSSNLGKRLVWQEAQHAHAHRHIARAQKVLASFTTGLTFETTRGELRRWKRWHDIVWAELQETRAALRPAIVALSSGSGGGGSVGCAADGFQDDGGYNFGLQFADEWLCVYPWLDGSQASQIRAAEILGSQSEGDPWPNCPDPYDGSGASWNDTVACENGGDW
jgi:hypothetical protein